LKELKIDAISLREKKLGPDELWDLGTSTNPVVINLETLTMEPGSRIEIRNTILSFTCENVIRNGSTTPSSEGANYDFGIFGETPKPPPVASTGGTGGTGNDGKLGTCKCSNTQPGDPGKPGDTGGRGGDGSPGARGDNGLPSLKAEITITKSLTGTKRWTGDRQNGAEQQLQRGNSLPSCFKAGRAVCRTVLDLSRYGRRQRKFCSRRPLKLRT